MLKLLKVGYCCHPEAMVMRGHSWKSMKFPAIVGLLKHPTKGYILFDTGYAKRFLDETSNFPEICYRWLTPMHLCDKENLINQLSQLNISADDISYIFISHFHADHIAGLMDFPAAKFICSRVALQEFNRLGRLRGLLKGYLSKLLPANFTTRCQFIENSNKITTGSQFIPFTSAYDIFNDGGFIAISLPGHATGQYGLLIESQGRPKFLVGDACWTQEAYLQSKKPNILTHLIMDNGQQYLQTLENLSQFYQANKNIQIIPSHCQLSFDAFQHDQ